VRLKLQGKPFQILQALLERPGQVVTREELQQRLWGDDNVDFESGLNTAANRLRLALGDSADNPQYVETLSRIGYRFIAPVEDNRAAPPSQNGHSLPAIIETPVENEIRVVSKPSPYRFLAGVCAGAIAAGILVWALRPAPSQPTIQQITFRRGSVNA